ncbi:MAG: hypothetical protein KF817_09960 [Phycisphaeraceae bacterium]|nr:hypothetical protein [Phycisphaeraceae bacterium]
MRGVHCLLRAGRCAPIGILCLLALALPAGREASATALTIKPGMDLGAQGLTVRVSGTGLAASGSGAIAFPLVNGPVRRAVLYWGGSHATGGAPHGSLVIAGTTVNGVLTGSEPEGTTTWYAYRADVTNLVKGAALPGGAIPPLPVSDPLFGDPMGALNGASIVLYHIDPTTPFFYRAQIADGCDFAWAPNLPDASGSAAPVTFAFDPAAIRRPAELGIVVGNANSVRRDRVDISDNKPLIDDFTGGNGAAWDSILTQILIPASVSQTTVTSVSPPQYGANAERFQLVAYAWRLICGGRIGDFVWQDQNGNGIQDPGEPGIAGVRIELYMLTDEGEEYVMDAVSDGTGEYLFEGICVGTYILRVDMTTLPAGFAPTIDFAGNDPALDSNFDPDGVTIVVLNDDGESNLDVDLGLCCGITIQTGACCFFNGDCQQLSESACGQLGGTFFGIGTPCAAINCPPLGACCLFDGSCQEIEAADCAALGGTYSAGVRCDSVTCPALGACCLFDGTCDVTDSAMCTVLGGSFQAGVDCAGIVCPALGACCLFDGSCVEVEAAVCVSLSGTYSPGMRCAEVVCPALGACCLFDGTCMDLTAENCIAAGGQAFLPGVPCEPGLCTSLGSCCFFDGSCRELTAAECLDEGGVDFHPGVACGEANCAVLGACCLFDGSCVETDATDCAAQGGTFNAAVPCDQVSCPVLGACCLFDGSCVETDATDCAAQGGTFNAAVPCAQASCPVLGACCLQDGQCVETDAPGCTAAGGTFQPGQPCAAVACPQPGACCLPGGQCVQSVRADGADCVASGGTYQGAGTTCAPGLCPSGPTRRVRSGEKGSLLWFSKVEIRWDASGQLVRDTFISLTNDYPSPVRVLMYFVNGDEPLPAAPGERAHPGWNFVDNAVVLTNDQPVWWSAASGLGTLTGLSPFTVLDPGTPPGRPAGDGTTDRVLRGFIVGWATNATGRSIHWNHLSGAATAVDLRDSAAWEYGAWAFRAGPSFPHGSVIGTPGRLDLDGETYAAACDTLLLGFRAHGSASFSGPNALVTAVTELTLHPVDLDLRLNHAEAAPVATTARFDVWNENEVKFSGAHRCVTCWDSAFLDAYAIPNHFRLSTLQSDAGKARIAGRSGPPCPDLPWPTRDTALLGVSMRRLEFSAVERDLAGGNLHGMGVRAAVIRFDAEAPPPEAPEAEGQGERGRSR